MLLASSQPITDGSIRIARQIDIFPIDCSGIPPAPVITNSGGECSISVCSFRRVNRFHVKTSDFRPYMICALRFVSLGVSI